MWVEAILEREDLEKLVGDFCPLQIKIGEGGMVLLSDPRDVSVVPGIGLRTTVAPQIHWPILGIKVPVAVRAATLEVRPEIRQGPEGDALAFKLRLDDIDCSVFPAFVERG